MTDRDELVGAIREAIAPMWRDTQERISNVRDTLRGEISDVRDTVRDEISNVRDEIQSSEKRVGARIDAVDARLSDLAASVEKLWERQPIVIDFERFRKLEERLSRLEEKLG